MSAQRLNREQLHAFLPRLLAGPDESVAAPPTVSNFEAYLQHSAIAWIAFAESADPARFAALSLILPGKVGFILLSQPIGPPANAVAVLQTTLEIARTEHPQHYAQSLVECEATAKQAILRAAGFVRLTTLNYLERRVVYPWVDPPALPLAWETFGTTNRERFLALINASYIDSTDCPELIGRRPMEDVLAAHQASGLFDPSLWYLARRDNFDLGCALVNPQPNGSVAELVYLGVAPAARRQGIGRVLLQKTLDACRARRFEQLLVVVDERNAPARRLYDAFHFTLNTKREAWLHFH